MGLCYNLFKAYNGMQMSIVERNLRWVLWKPNTETDMKEFAFNKVQFSDRPAACLMSLGLIKASEHAKRKHADNIDIIADADKVVDDTYVDDGTTGGSVEDLDRMMGERLLSGKFNGTIPTMLAEVGFQVKTMVRSGDLDKEAIDLLGSSVLGYNWEAFEDKMMVILMFNPSKKRNKDKAKS